jgi:hypothetical protein
MPLGQLCLTDLGGFELTDLVNIYSDVDGFTTPIDQNVLIESMASSVENCPYFLNNVPEGTTQIYIETVGGEVCLYLPFQEINLCEECWFGFDVFTSQTIGSLSVGILTAPCTDEITDYAIDWYNSNGEIELTSGFGDQFEYTYPHPLTGDQSPPIDPGIYQPIIRQVLINGVIYSSVEFGNNNVFDPSLSGCLPNYEVIVSPNTCDNGNTPNGTYSHQVYYNATLGEIPSSMDIVLEIDSSVNYIAWAFDADAVTDQIKVVFSGSAYSEKYILDWFNVGQLNISTSFSEPPPYEIQFLQASSGDRQDLKKVNCLTGFTVSEGDKIIFEVIPNQSNNNTNWNLRYKCLETFDCESCWLTGTSKINLTNGFGINSIQNTCTDRRAFLFNLSGSCSSFEDNLNDYFQTQFILNPPQVQPTWPNTGSDVINRNLPNGSTSYWNTSYLYFTQLSYGSFSSSISPACNTPSTNQIQFTKTYNPGIQEATIYMYFTNQSDFLSYWNNYLSVSNQFSSTQNTNDPEYYEGYVFIVRPQPTPTTQCGDTSPDPITYYIPKDALFVSGQTDGGGYELQVFWGPVYNNISASNCAYGTINSVVNSYTNSRTGNNTSFINNRGSRPIDPVGKLEVSTNNQFQTAATLTYRWVFHRKLNETLPRNYNDTNIIYPQYSSVTCPNLYTLDQANSPNTDYYRKIYARYRIELINQSDPEEFRVLSQSVSGNDLAFVYSGGTINNVNTNYVIQ